MTQVTGTILHAVPNPDYVDAETTPNEPPTIDQGWNEFMWLVEVDTDTPGVYPLAVDEGVIEPDDDIPAGQYRIWGEHSAVASGRPSKAGVVTVQGVKGRNVTTYPDATYDPETGELIDQGDPVVVFMPIVDGGGVGPVIVIPADEPATIDFWEARQAYVPPIVEEESNV